MKLSLTRSFFILSCIVVCNIALHAQSPSDFFKAFEKKDFVTIESYLAPEIDLCIKDLPEINLKSDALLRMKNFISAEDVKSVEEIHQGTSKLRSSGYKVAKLTTSKGVYRLFVYSENSGKSLRVKEVRVDKF